MKMPAELWENLRLYHLRGGVCHGKMRLLHRMMMGMMVKMLGKKPESALSGYERELLGYAHRDVDFTDRSTIAPLVWEIRADTGSGMGPAPK